MPVRTEAWPEGTPCWIDLMVDDVDAAVSFYSSLFGWEIPAPESDMGGYRVCTLDDHAVAGLSPMSPEMPMGTAWSTYLAVSDCDAITERAKSAGASIGLEPVDVMSLGRMSFGSDPAGAEFGLWQSGEFIGAQLANEPGAFVWNQQLSNDFAGSKAFYSAILGYTYNDMPGGESAYAIIARAGDGEPVGGIGELSGPGSARWDTYFMVDDCDRVTALVSELGGSVAAAPFDTPFGRMSDVVGAQGETFSLMSANPQSEGDTLG